MKQLERVLRTTPRTSDPDTHQTWGPEPSTLSREATYQLQLRQKIRKSLLLLTQPKARN